MKDIKIVHLGLSRLQEQTLRCHFHKKLERQKITPEYLNDEEQVRELLSGENCVFINPQKLTTEQLEALLETHEYTKKYTHAAILAFTNPFTVEQKKAIDTKNCLRVDLIKGRDRKLLNIDKLIRQASLPCSENFEDMKANMFNDGWYLIDFETSGFDPCDDEIISFSIAYMADYEIEYTNTYYVKPTRPISSDIEDATGISNEMLETGISKAELVEIIRNLPSPSPLIVYSEEYFVPFLKALFIGCGEHFDIPYLAMNELSAHVFGYTNYRQPFNLLPEDAENYTYVEKLHALTVRVFGDLKERYQIRAMGEISNLYHDYYNEIKNMI